MKCTDQDVKLMRAAEILFSHLLACSVRSLFLRYCASIIQSAGFNVRIWGEQDILDTDFNLQVRDKDLCIISNQASPFSYNL